METGHPDAGDDHTVAHLRDDVLELARRAGAAILEVYATDFGVTAKADHSPLTAADMASHRILVEGLRGLTPDVPVLSEESEAVAKDVRHTWHRFWLVDPLDGTKEFVARNGEFTVNVALVEGGVPVLGVVHAPVLGVSYAGTSHRQGQSASAWRYDDQGAAHPIRTEAPGHGAVRVVASRSHSNTATEAFIDGLRDRFGDVALTSRGSALKICLVAEGAAHYYPRLGPTMEWDTAAAHAVLAAAGGALVRADDHAPLRYNKDELTNPHFLALHHADAFLPLTPSRAPNERSR
ncbi:MAG: 3'(2'),5'-bisphosphate nucleotidase CysQ [Trueperaceae bacterium]